MLAKNVLLAEDEEIIARHIQSTLVDLGYHMSSVVSNASDALRSVERVKPDIVLMDFTLKGEMDSVEAARQMYYIYDIPVVFLSSYMDEEILQRTNKTNPFGYLIKPFKDIELLSTIEISLHNHQKERSLKMNQYWFSSVLKNISEAVIVTNQSNEITYMNKMAQTLTGWSFQEANGKILSDVFFVSKLVNSYTPYTKNYSDKKYITNEMLINKDGITVIPIQTSSTQIVDQNSRFIGNIIVFHDITNYEKIIKDLMSENNILHDDLSNYDPIDVDCQESEARFRKRIQNISGYIYDVEFQNNQVISTYHSPRCLEITGYTPEEYQNNPNLWIEMVFHEDKQHVREHLKNIRRNVNHPIIEHRIIRKDGSIRWVSNTCTIQTNSENKIIRETGFIIDITDHKKIEEELKIAKDQAESANHIKTMFLANMSHEIRTPMNGIIGMIEILADTNLNDKQRDYLYTIKESADSLLMIINDVLDFSKIEEDKLTLEYIPFNLADCLSYTIKPFAIQSSKKNVELIYFVSPNVPAMLIGDPGRLKQIIINLIGNAVKFTEKGKIIFQVEVDPEQINSQDNSDNITLLFSVLDTGIGISPDKKESIFDSFSQADPMISNQYGGTGLGLAISQRLVKMMNGKISLESKIGKGSKFFFSIIFKIPNQNEWIVPTLDSLGSLNNLSVLIVDNNPVNCSILKETLINWKMKPIVVRNTATAQAVIRKAKKNNQSFQLIIIDRQMPDKDGFKLAKSIQKSLKSKDIPIIMITSTSLKGDARLCKTNGISAYLVRPVEQSELLQTITMVINPLINSDLITSHSLKENIVHLKIMVAEDNKINQKIIINILEKWGHHVILAENGWEAIALLEKNHIDIVFMDVLMPIMNGIEATEVIREKEKITGQHVIIVAMTAYAMREDKERCLRAGMDAYISKPIKLKDIYDLIYRYTCKLQNNQAINELVIPSNKIFDLDQVLNNLQGDKVFLKELIELFLNKNPKTLFEISQAIERQDINAIAMAIHSLKGVLLNLCAFQSVDFLESLEKKLQVGDFDKIKMMYNKLLEQISILKEELRNIS